jgi:hypothetical protein
MEKAKIATGSSWPFYISLDFVYFEILLCIIFRVRRKLSGTDYPDARIP